MVTISEIIEYCNSYRRDNDDDHLIDFLDKIGPLDDKEYTRFVVEIIENLDQCTDSGKTRMMDIIHHADNHDPFRSTKFFNSLIYFDFHKSVREELYGFLESTGNKTTIPHLKYVFFNEDNDDCRYVALLGLITLLRDENGIEINAEGRRFFGQFLDEEKQLFSQNFYQMIQHLKLT
jgi:hypothetical protein